VTQFAGRGKSHRQVDVAPAVQRLELRRGVYVDALIPRSVIACEFSADGAGCASQAPGNFAPRQSLRDVFGNQGALFCAKLSVTHGVCSFWFGRVCRKLHPNCSSLHVFLALNPFWCCTWM